MKISIFFSKQTATLLAAICLVGAFQSVASAQTWNGIMLSGEAVEYYQYTNGTRTEVSVDNSSLAQLQVTSRPPFTYSFALIPGPNGTQRSVCPYTDQTDPSHPAYWYSDGTGSASHSMGATTAPPTQFHESRNLTGVKRLEFLGTFSSDTSLSGGTSAAETVYFTDRHCTDGGREFGFGRNLTEATNRVVFYQSDFTNCTSGSTIFCRKTAHPDLVFNGQDNLQPQQPTDPVVNSTLSTPSPTSRPAWEARSSTSGRT